MGGGLSMSVHQIEGVAMRCPWYHVQGNSNSPISSR